MSLFKPNEMKKYLVLLLVSSFIMIPTLKAQLPQESLANEDILLVLPMLKSNVEIPVIELILK